MKSENQQTNISDEISFKNSDIAVKIKQGNKPAFELVDDCIVESTTNIPQALLMDKLSTSVDHNKEIGIYNLERNLSINTFRTSIHPQFVGIEIDVNINWRNNELIKIRHNTIFTMNSELLNTNNIVIAFRNIHMAMIGIAYSFYRTKSKVFLEQTLPDSFRINSNINSAPVLMLRPEKLFDGKFKFHENFNIEKLDFVMKNIELIDKDSYSGLYKVDVEKQCNYIDGAELEKATVEVEYNLITKNIQITEESKEVLLGRVFDDFEFFLLYEYINFVLQHRMIELHKNSK